MVRGSQGRSCGQEYDISCLFFVLSSDENFWKGFLHNRTCSLIPLPVGEKDLEGHQGMSRGDQLADRRWDSDDVTVNGRNEGSRNGGRGRGETGEL